MRGGAEPAGVRRSVGADGSGTCVRQLDLPQLEQSIQRRALLYDKVVKSTTT